MVTLRLERPAMRHKTSYIEAALEFEAEGRIKPDWNIQALEDHFDEYLEVIAAREQEPMAGYVPQSDYWLTVNGVFAGRISIRHKVNERLLNFGGHIGYEIRPSMRKRGYGTWMCREALVICREMGLKRVLITCDDDNVGSYKIIETNGGVLENKVDNGRGVLTRRYWIDL